MTIEEQSNIAYLNVTVHDASMAVKKRVREKLGKFPKPVQNQAAQAACFFTTPKKSAQVLSQRLCEELPCMFSKRGINIEVEEIFREGPYIVLKLLVLNVDTQAMDKNWIRWFTRTFGFKERIEKDLLPNLVTRQLPETMPAIIDEKLASNKITAETKVNNRRDQEQYFQLKLEELREEEEARKNKQPLRKLKKRMSSSDNNSKSKAIEDDEDEIIWNTNLRYKLKKKISSISTSSSADERDKENRKANEGAEARKGTSSRWSLRRKDTLSSDAMTKTRKIEILEV